ncbi:MAG TPA: hypothetical protein VHF07_09315 [Nitrospiraceae bacterium]|nr:hypothetical protein [Nitrospiraceae bacterium]
MLRFLGLIVLLLSAFALGYTWGKRPRADLEQTVRDLSRNVVDTTLGIERDLRRREGLINAKARIVQAKSDLLSKHTTEAAEELAEAIEALESAVPRTQNIDPGLEAKQLAGRLRLLKSDIAQGKKGGAAKLDTIQKEVDSLLNR